MKTFDFALDLRAPARLLRQCRVLALGLNTLGNVVVGADPKLAALDRTIDDRYGAPVGRLDDALRLMTCP